MVLTTAPRGTRDILSPEVEKWQYLERSIRQVCDLYAYQEIRLPLFEHTELFQRSVGESTDIVQKEMYTFSDRGGRYLTLRPEATASTVRAYLENNLNAGPQPVKLFYLGPMFRYDRPQAGRYRQFNQFGIEVIGTGDPAVDVEVIMLALHLFEDLGLSELEVQLNSIGCPGCRQGYQRELLTYLEGQRTRLCPDCQVRVEQNPLRVLDCKEEECQAVAASAPAMADHLCPECREHFSSLTGILDRLQVRYSLNPRLVRGLDYYTRTVFEIVSHHLGSQGTICGGGRYDGLVEELGGDPTPSVGFALGLERLLLALERTDTELPDAVNLDVFVAVAGDEARPQAFTLLQALRRQGKRSDMDFLGRSLRAQMKAAHRSGARWALLLGPEEMARGMATVRCMASGNQEEVHVAEIAQYLDARREAHS